MKIKKSIKRINKTRNWFSENINKKDKPLVRNKENKEKSNRI